MRKIKVICLSLAVLLCLLLSGCRWLEPPVPAAPTALCFVAGRHSSFPAVNFRQFRDDVYEVAYHYGSVGIVLCDGEPSLAGDFDIGPVEGQSMEIQRKPIAKQNTDAILAAFDGLDAKTEELDSLRAIDMAADLLQSREIEQKKLIVVDSLLSTAAPLNFAENDLLEADPQEILRQLEAQSAIPDLTGVDVLALGCGQTVAPQERLSNRYAENLKQIWTVILEAAGCKSLNFDDGSLGSEVPGELPPVSAVAPGTNEISIPKQEPIPEQEPPQALPKGVISVIDEETVRFLADQAVFADPEEARAALAPIAETLRADPACSYLLAGMTASTGGDGVALSLERAEAVKAELVRAGAAEAQLHCIGLGRQDNSLRADDLNEDGTLNENAARNRAVFLISTDSETARELLAEGN